MLCVSHCHWRNLEKDIMAEQFSKADVTGFFKRLRQRKEDQVKRIHKSLINGVRCALIVVQGILLGLPFLLVFSYVWIAQRITDRWEYI